MKQRMKGIVSFVLAFAIMVSMVAMPTYAASNGKNIYLSFEYIDAATGNPITSVSANNYFGVNVVVSGNPTTSKDASMQSYDLLVAYNAEKVTAIQINQGKIDGKVYKGTYTANPKYNSSTAWVGWGSKDGFCIEETEGILSRDVLKATGVLFCVVFQAKQDLTVEDLNSIVLTETAQGTSQIQSSHISDKDRQDFNIIQVPALTVPDVTSGIYDTSSASDVQNKISGAKFINATGTETDVANSNLTITLPQDGLKAGDNDVTATYNGVSTTFKVTAAEDTLSSIAVTTDPTKTTYVSGEKFDPAGMVVTGTYASGATKAVTDFTLSPGVNDDLRVANSSVSISYSGKSTSQAITVNPKSITPPTATGTYTYTGSEQTFTLGNNTDADYYTVTGDNTTNGNTKGTNAGNYTATVALKDKTETKWSDSTTADKTLTWTMKPLEATLSWNGATTRTYNGNASNVTASVSNKIGSDNVTVVVTDGDKTAAGTHTAKATGLDGAAKGNYKLPTTEASVQKQYTIEKASLTMAATVATKAYDATTAATIHKGDLSGVVSTDTGKVSVAPDSISGTFGDAKVGANKTVTTTNQFTLTGDAAENYTLTQPTGLKGEITRANYNYTVAGTQQIKVGSDLSAITVAPASGTGVNGESVSGSVAWYTNDDCTTAAQNTDISAKQVGNTVTLYWKFTPSAANYSKTAKTGHTVFTIVEGDPQNLTFATPNSVTKTYGDPSFENKITKVMTKDANGQDKDITKSHGTITYASNNPAVATVNETSGQVTIVGQGTTTITATAAAIPGTYAQGTQSYTLTVNKANATVPTAPRAVTGLTYTNDGQALVTAGTPSGGEMQYATSANGNFSTNIPEGTNAGTYTVYYKVVGDANHNDTSVRGPVNVTIAKAANPVELQKTSQATVKFKNTLELSQFVKNAVGDVTFAITGSNLGSKVEGSDFTAGTTAGTVSVKVTAAGNDNYNKGELTLPVTVVAKDPQSNFKFAEATQTKTYGNASFTVTATGAESGSSVTYASSDTSVATVNETTGAVTILKAGETTITATASETEAYAQATASYVLTVNKAAPGLNQPTAVSGLGYTGEAKALVNAGSTEDGTMQYALGQDSENAPTTGYQAAVPTGTDAGTYFVWYKVVGDENHSDSTPACVANISIAKADRNLSVDKDSLTLTPASQADDGKVTLSYNDLDKSAKVSSSLSSQAVKVSSSEKDYTFTAQSNGNATATFTIPETKNYNASDTKTVTITSVSEAVTDVTASIKEPLAGGKDAVSAALSDDGKSIEVTGMKAENSEITVSATPAVQGWSAVQDGDKLIVKDAKGNEIATYNIVDKTEALPDNAANVNVTSQDAAVKADENDLKAAVSEQINEDLKDTPNANVTVDPGITATADETKPNEKKVTLAPTYTPEGATDPTPIKDFAGKVKMTMNLPNNFVPTSVTQDGKALDFTVNGTNPKTVTWYQDKPGEVTLTADDRTGFITYNKADSSSVTLPYTAADLEKALETDSKENNTFNGWSFNGIEGTFKTLKDAVLSAMNAAGNKTLIATPSFTPNSSGNNGGGGGAAPAAPVSVTNPDNGKVTLSPSSPKAGDTVTVTPTPDQGYKTDKVTVTDSKGNQVPVTKNEDGTYTFTVPKSNTPVKVNASFVKDDSGEKPDQNLKFVDVPKDAYYFDAVYWAVDQGITSGTSETTFSPDAPCTRAQAVTFLWRAAGEPTPASTENPFTDVKSDDYFYNAVLWAVEKGITKGTRATTFSPNDTVIRGQMVTFMYRAAGEPAVSQSNPFTDVAANAYYLNAVLWAVKENITSGTSATTFSPNADCLRSQIVTFLYRDAQ